MIGVSPLQNGRISEVFLSVGNIHYFYSSSPAGMGMKGLLMYDTTSVVHLGAMERFLERKKGRTLTTVIGL